MGQKTSTAKSASSPTLEERVERQLRAEAKLRKEANKKPSSSMPESSSAASTAAPSSTAESTSTSTKTTTSSGAPFEVTEAQKAQLLRWIGPQASRNWELLYQASRDGFAASDFHKRCDKQGPTVTLALNQAGTHVCGGYSPVSWENCPMKYVPSSEAFLFSLVNTEQDLGMVHFPVTQSQYAIVLDADSGPWFGGYDFHLRDHCNTEQCKTQLGYAYDGPEATRKLLMGKEHFLVRDYIVYALR